MSAGALALLLQVQRAVADKVDPKLMEMFFIDNCINDAEDLAVMLDETALMECGIPRTSSRVAILRIQTELLSSTVDVASESELVNAMDELIETTSKKVTAALGQNSRNRSPRSSVNVPANETSCAHANAALLGELVKEESHCDEAPANSGEATLSIVSALRSTMTGKSGLLQSPSVPEEEAIAMAKWLSRKDTEEDADIPQTELRLPPVDNLSYMLQPPPPYQR